MTSYKAWQFKWGTPARLNVVRDGKADWMDSQCDSYTVVLPLLLCCYVFYTVVCCVCVLVLKFF